MVLAVLKQFGCNVRCMFVSNLQHVITIQLSMIDSEVDNSLRRVSLRCGQCCCRIEMTSAIMARLPTRVRTQRLRPATALRQHTYLTDSREASLGRLIVNGPFRIASYKYLFFETT